MEFKELNYDLVHLEGTMTDINLNDKTNWFYRQVEATIRYAFFRDDCEDILPRIVFVDRSMDNIGIIVFALSGFHGNVETLAELHKNKTRIMETLNQTADSNSTDEITYKFEFI